jgi:hypothetical protein
MPILTDRSDSLDDLLEFSADWPTRARDDASYGDDIAHPGTIIDLGGGQCIWAVVLFAQRLDDGEGDPGPDELSRMLAMPQDAFEQAVEALDSAMGEPALDGGRDTGELSALPPSLVDALRRAQAGLPEIDGADDPRWIAYWPGEAADVVLAGFSEPPRGPMAVILAVIPTG